MFLSQSCLINTLRLYREAFFLSITVQKYSYEYNYFHFTLNYNTKLTIVQLLKSIKSKLWFLSIFEHFSAPDSYVLNKHLLLFAPFLKELLINAQISVPFFLRCKKHIHTKVRSNTEFPCYNRIVIMILNTESIRIEICLTYISDLCRITKGSGYAWRIARIN